MVGLTMQREKDNYPWDERGENRTGPGKLIDYTWEQGNKGSPTVLFD